MKQKLLFIPVILSVALVFAIAACDNGSYDDLKPDLTELNAVIAEAEAAKVGVLAASKAEDVAKVLQWVPVEKMQDLDKKIDNAKAALKAKTQVEVDFAIYELSGSITTFKDAKQDGSKTQGFTLNELAVLIDIANDAKKGVNVSVTGDGKDFPPQEYWVTQERMTALDDAINAAEEATAGTIDTRFNALSSALVSFNTAKSQGTGKYKRTLTITGLEEADETEIELGLFETDQISGDELPEIGGEGTIQNKSVTINLFYYDTTTLWDDNGSYYARIQLTAPPKTFISRSPITFSDTGPNQEIPFSNFKDFVDNED